MGADLMIVRSRWPQYADGKPLGLDVARVVLRERCDALGGEALVELYNGTVSAYDDEETDTSDMGPARLAEVTRQRLRAAVDAVTDEGSWRELSLMSFDEKEWILTGGMSWGDPPTEMFASVAILGDSGVCEAAVGLSGSEGGGYC